MTLGPLVGADEQFTHQIVDTFGTVAQSDRSWTEKAWAQACANDGSLQVAFGIGKYPNRDVLDACAGVSRGTEQWAVRGSRQLSKDRDSLAVGPIRYRIDDALDTVTFSLEASNHQPIAFEWRFEGMVPPFLENREVHRARDGSRMEADIVRFHQAGVATGWVEIDGERTEIAPSSSDLDPRSFLGRPLSGRRPGGGRPSRPRVDRRVDADGLVAHPLHPQ